MLAVIECAGFPVKMALNATWFLRAGHACICMSDKLPILRLSICTCILEFMCRPFLGAAIVSIRSDTSRIIFSGDLGRPNASIKIRGEYVPLRAGVKQIDNLSAHAGRGEILNWLSHFLRHRSRSSLHTVNLMLQTTCVRQFRNLHWSCRVPEHMESVELSQRPARAA